MLLGAAMLGALAGSVYSDANSAMQAMSRSGGANTPNPKAVELHLQRYKIFTDLQNIAARAT